MTNGAHPTRRLRTLLGAAWRRLGQSPVAWSWAMNGFRLAAGLILLPLLLLKLPEAEFAIHVVFNSLLLLIPILDFGFSVSISRHVSYAMAGATELKPMGFTPSGHASEPNRPLLWQLLGTTRRLFRHMALGSFVLLGAIGTWSVHLGAHQTASPTHTWLAWAITLAAATWELYSGWWNTFLRGMNQVLLGARISVLVYAGKLLLASALLVAGAGLLAVPVSGLLAGFAQRAFSRRACLDQLGPAPARPPRFDPGLLRVLWPNSWRAGLQFLSAYLASQANVYICMASFGTAVTAKYGLSLTLTAIIQGMATVWTLVKWPLIGQLRSRQNQDALRRLIWPRLWLQSVTYLILAAATFALGPSLLQWLDSGKEILSPPLFALLLLTGFLDSHFSFWTTLLSTENRIPSLWPTFATNLGSFLAVLCLVRFSSLGVASLVLAPLAFGCLFSYWYWPLAGAKSIGTAWFRFTFLGPGPRG